MCIIDDTLSGVHRAGYHKDGVAQWVILILLMVKMIMVVYMYSCM